MTNDVHSLTTTDDLKTTPNPDTDKHEQLTLTDGTTIRSGELYAVTIPASNSSPDTPDARTIIGTLDCILTKRTTDGTFYIPVFTDGGRVPVSLEALEHGLTIPAHLRNKHENSPHDTITVRQPITTTSGP